MCKKTKNGKSVLIVGSNPIENRDIFLVAETKLREFGYEVINPLKFQTPGLRASYQLRNYITQFALVQAVCFLPNWHELQFAATLQGLQKGMELQAISLKELHNEAV
ncbi:MAG: DUF4406 domain-containing protein [Bacteroidales bacterium]|jgi:hypothetical protein|nr:DUF4406 domain-containing protein [Bacteroidales bacterium]